MNKRPRLWFLAPIVLGGCTQMIDVVGGHDTDTTSGGGGASAGTTSTSTGGAAPCTAGSCQAACDVSAGLQPGAAWPMVGGCPTRHGQSPFVGAATAAVRWVLPLGDAAYGTGQVTIDADGTIYAATNNALYAARPDGTLQISMPGAAFMPPAVMADGSLFVVDWSALRSLDPDSGEEKWSVPVAHDEYVAPAIGAGGTLFHGDGGRIVALTSTGAVAWKGPDSGFGLNSSPAIAPDGSVYHVGHAGLLALGAGGTTLWARPLQGVSLGSPAVGADGTIYVGNGGHLYAFHPNGDLRWDVALAADEQRFAWVSIGPDGTLFAVGIEQAAIFAVSPVDGSVRWTQQVPGHWAGPAVVDAAGNVFAPLGGFIYALSPDGAPRWTYGGNDCSGVAIGSDGTVYAGCAGQIVAIGP